jgi:hypothetical protein
VTEDEVKKAVKYAENFCRVLENAYDDDVLPYTMVSARSVLKHLNYTPEEQNQILAHMSHEGFNYCLDPRIPHVMHNTETGDTRQEFPPEHACWWGMDQLRSRLQSI